MEVKFHIARHTWKEGENAGWSYNGLPSDIQNDLEKDYYRLARNKPDHEIYKNRLVFFIYEETKDFIHRPITEITAICSDIYISYSKEVYDELERTVRAIDNECASVKLNIKIRLIDRIKNCGILSKKEKNYKKNRSKLQQLPTIAMMLVFLCLILVFVIKANFRNQSFDDLPSRVPKSETKANLKTDDEKNLPSGSSDGAFTKKFCHKYQISKDESAEVPSIDKYSDKCIGIYVDHRCSGQLKKLSYRNWVNQKHNNGSVPRQCQYSGAGEEVTDFIRALSSENHFEGIDLRRFFNGK
jgi:hypothetical protein